MSTLVRLECADCGGQTFAVYADPDGEVNHVECTNCCSELAVMPDEVAGSHCTVCGGLAPGHALACPHFAGTITRPHIDED